MVLKINSFSIGLLAIIFLLGCGESTKNISENDFTTLDLLISLDNMPLNWEVVSGTPSRMLPNDGDENDSRIIFKPHNRDTNGAYQYVWQYKNISNSERFYEKKIPTYFVGGIDWEVPSEWLFSSERAEQFLVGCDSPNDESVEVCTAMWQYKEYVVVFFVPSMNSELMTIKQFEAVVQEIDQQLELFIQ